jgi:hypothetical protein
VVAVAGFGLASWAIWCYDNQGKVSKKATLLKVSSALPSIVGGYISR